jgi:hypothetical protein
MVLRKFLEPSFEENFVHFKTITIFGGLDNAHELMYLNELKFFCHIAFRNINKSEEAQQFFS